MNQHPRKIHRSPRTARRATYALIMSTLVSCKTNDGNSSSTELEGVWTSTCRPRVESPSSTYYEKNTIGFSANTMTSTVQSYLDEYCDIEIKTKPSLTGVSTFSIGDYVAGAGGARKFNSQMSSLTVTLTTDAYVAAYNGTTPNTNPVCGGGFVKNQPKPLDATLCAPDEKMRREFAPRYDIYKIAGNIVYFGYMGDAGSATDGSSETTRPVALDPSYFTKN